MFSVIKKQGQSIVNAPYTFIYTNTLEPCVSGLHMLGDVQLSFTTQHLLTYTQKLHFSFDTMLVFMYKTPGHELSKVNAQVFQKHGLRQELNYHCKRDVDVSAKSKYYRFLNSHKFQ